LTSELYTKFVEDEEITQAFQDNLKYYVPTDVRKKIDKSIDEFLRDGRSIFEKEIKIHLR